MTLWLDPIPLDLREAATAALNAGDAVGFLVKASNVYSLDLVRFNQRRLKEVGIYESALLHALTGARVNNHHYPIGLLQDLCTDADRARLQAAGDPLPGTGPFTVFRGVAGRGPARRVRGLSWTFSLHAAAWFASRLGLSDPAVYRVTVREAHVLAYANEGFRNEAELLLMLPPQIKPERILAGEELRAAAEEHTAPRKLERERRMEQLISQQRGVSKLSG